MSEIWNLSALCRCCHSDGNFKSLQIPYAVENGVEIYSCMLEETLGIHISPPPFEASYTICDPCILKLRDSAAFKNLVLSCEQKFKEYCKNEMSLNLLTDNIKIESDDYHENGDDFVGDDTSHHDECDDKSQLNVVKQELILDMSLAGDVTIDKDSKDDISTEPEKKTLVKKPKKPNLNKEKAGVKSSKKANLVSKKQVKVNKKPNLSKDNAGVKSCKKPNLVLKKQVTINKKRNLVVKKTEDKDVSEEAKSKGRMCLKEPKVEKGIKGDQTNNILIKCELCHKQFKIEKTLKLHMVNKHFKCEYCREEFKTKRRFSIHLKLHKVDRTYSCKHCGKSYNDAFNAYEHESSHTRQTYTCDLCKKDFKYKYSLRKHILWHYGRNKKYLCDLCGHSFNDKTNLVKHVQSVHEKLRPFTCEICSKTYSTKRHLGDHHKKVHEATEVFNCDKCLKSFTTKESLEIHELRHENKFKCRYCATIYEDRRIYLSHLLMHQTNQNRLKNVDRRDLPAKCEICNKYLASKYSLRRHRMYYHTVHSKSNGKEFACTLCISSFTQKDSLHRHIKNIHGPKKNKIFEKCTVCNRNSSNLEKHMRNHTNRPYNCEYCHKVYGNGSALNRHVRDVHFGTIHECDLCGKTYNLLKSYKRHKLKEHNISWKTETTTKL